MERSLGLQPAPFMEAKDEAVQCHMEASFITTVAQPLWEAMARLFPDLGVAATRIGANAGIYQALTQLPPSRIVQVLGPRPSCLSQECL